MNIDNYEDYFKYKIKTVYQYSILLSKILGIDKNKLWHKKKDTEDSLNYIINDYFNKITFPVDKDLVRCFINNKEISKYNIDRELDSVITYFIDKERAFEIKAYEKEIILCAIVIYIANNIDISTSPYTINKINYKTILVNYLEKFNKTTFVHIIDDGKKNTNILLELIKTNVRKERKIYELLNSNISFNKYIDISKENNYYITQYNYSVPGLKDINSGAVNYIFNKDGYDNKFTIISAELVVVILMKLLSVRKFNKIFFIPIKKKFLLDDTYFNKIKNLNKNKYLKNRIMLLINYDDIDEIILNKLKKSKLNYYIYASKNTKANDLDNNERYLISKDFYMDHKELIDQKLKEKIEIIIEAFDGLVLDRNIAEES